MINPLDLNPLAMRLYAKEQHDRQISQVCTACWSFTQTGILPSPKEGWSLPRWKAAINHFLRKIEK